jgi:Domain of unknown function (DUF1735)
MKLKNLIIPGILSAFLLSSCLKDTPYLDASNTAPIIEFGISPANGYSIGLAMASDTAGSPVVDTAIGLLIASPQVLNQAYTISVSLDTSLISGYNAANNDSLSALPGAYYTITDTPVAIAAQHRVGRMPITLNIPAMPAHHQYALALSITNGDGLLISGNSGTFIWLFQR